MEKENCIDKVSAKRVGGDKKYCTLKQIHRNVVAAQLVWPSVQHKL